MSSPAAWIKAMRLRTLPLSFANIFLGNALAHFYLSDPYSKGPNFSWTIFGLTLLTTLFLQILSNFANDYGDFVKGTDNKERVGPDRALQSGIISKKAMMIAIIITGVSAFLSGLALLLIAFTDKINTEFVGFLILGIAAIAAAVKYTVGKKAYGYSGMGDLFVFVFFGLVGVLGSYYLQTKQIDRTFLLPATIMGCLSVAVLNLNNMRDIVNDKASGKITMAVRLGFEKAKQYHYGLFLLAYASLAAFLVPLGIYGLSIFIWISPVVIIHIIHLVKVSKTKEPKELDSQLKVVALSAFLFSLIIFGLVIY